jgi:DNA-binding NarL/FixJ family response regulator
MDLLERESQWKRVHDAMQGVRKGQGAIALLGGEAGIGKTAFATALAASFRQMGRVLWGASDPLSTPRPLGPLYDIAVRDLPYLLDQLNAGAGWLAIAAALHKDLLESPAPTMLVFEDLHWADEATLDLVKYVGRRVQHTKTLLVLTYREDEAAGKFPLRSLLGDLPPQRLIRLQLDPLSEQAVETLAHRVNRSAKGVYQVTRGNPFFVTEVLHNDADELPPTVRDSVLGRLTHLPAPLPAILELASIIPGVAEPWLFESILHPEPAELDACIEAGFLLPSDETLAFRHELVRLAIEESLSMGRSKELHRKVLDVLRARPTGEIALARLVHHAAGAADASMLLEYAPQAAKQAAQHGAHREAARYYQAVLPYRRHLDLEARAHLLDDLSFENYLTGRIDPAIQVREEAVDLWRQIARPVEVGDDLRWLSRLYWFQGSKGNAERFAEEAIAALAPQMPGRELAMAYSNRSQLYMLEEENQAAITWGLQALQIAETLQEAEITVHALTNIGAAELLDGQPNGWERLSRALHIAQENEMHDHAARCYANLASIAVRNRDYALAEGYLREGLIYTIDRDIDTYSVYLLGWRARALFEQGRWAEAEADAMEMLRLHPGSAVIALPGITALGHLRARRGDPDAGNWLDQARDLASPTAEFQRIGPTAVARAEAAWWSAQPAQILQELEPALRVAGTVRDSYQLGAIAYWSKRAGQTVLTGGQIAAPYQALLDGDWRLAAQEWGRVGCPFERALALGEGDIAAQREALAIFETIGARPAARMLREQLQARGIRGLPRGARPSTRGNPEGLTAREMQILALIGQGLSNAEIGARLSISAKTVDHHVSAVLGKLQVHTRSEAAAAARQKNIL